MTSRIEWQWQDAGSGFGHMQKVAVYEPEPENLEAAEGAEPSAESGDASPA